MKLYIVSNNGQTMNTKLILTAIAVSAYSTLPSASGERLIDAIFFMLNDLELSLTR